MNELISGFAGLFAQFIRKAQRSIRTFVVYVCSPGSDASRCSQSCERSAAVSGGQRRPAALWLRLRRGQRLEATSISGPWGLFLSL